MLQTIRKYSNAFSFWNDFIEKWKCGCTTFLFRCLKLDSERGNDMQWNEKEIEEANARTDAVPWVNVLWNISFHKESQSLYSWAVKKRWLTSRSSIWMKQNWINKNVSLLKTKRAFKCLYTWCSCIRTKRKKAWWLRFPHSDCRTDQHSVGREMWLHSVCLHMYHPEDGSEMNCCQQQILEIYDRNSLYLLNLRAS